MPTFPYTEHQLDHPAGNNNLSPRSKFFQRTLYKEKIYPTDVPKPLEMWYSKNLFGRIDPFQNTIIARQNELVPVTLGVRPGLYCFNFVNDAFTAFAEHMRKGGASGCSDPNGNGTLLDPKAVLAWTDPVVKWNTYRQGIITSWINAFIEDRQKPIKNFRDFAPVFIAYLLEVAKQSAVTKTNFLLTNMVSPFISALSIGIADHDAGNDKIKYERFIADPNFNFYVESAKRFGFMVHKNMPWVLTADIGPISPAMEYYLGLYTTGDDHPRPGEPITKANFFESYYYHSYLTDPADIGHLIVGAYRQFIAQKPYYQEEKIIYDKRCNNVFQTRNYEREDIASDYTVPMTTMMALYVTLRHAESRYSKPGVAAVTPAVTTIGALAAGGHAFYGANNGGQGVGSAAPIEIQLSFVNSIFRQYIYPHNYDKINPNYLVDSTTAASIIETVVQIAQAASGLGNPIIRWDLLTPPSETPWYNS